MDLVVDLYGGSKLIVSNFSGVVNRYEDCEPTIIGSCMVDNSDLLCGWVQDYCDDTRGEDLNKNIINYRELLLRSLTLGKIKPFMEEERHVFKCIHSFATLLAGGVKITHDGVVYVLEVSLEEFKGTFEGRGFEESKRTEIENLLDSYIDQVSSKSEFFKAFFTYWT